MTDSPSQATPSTMPSFFPIPPVTRLFVALHAFLWCALMVYLGLYVPQAERQFHDFNMVLPAATLFVMTLSRLAGNYWYILVPLLFLWLLFEGRLLVILYRRSRLFGWNWALINTVLLFLLCMLIFFSIQIPLWRLDEALGR